MENTKENLVKAFHILKMASATGTITDHGHQGARGRILTSDFDFRSPCYVKATFARSLKDSKDWTYSVELGIHCTAEATETQVIDATKKLIRLQAMLPRFAPIPYGGFVEFDDLMSEAIKEVPGITFKP